MPAGGSVLATRQRPREREPGDDDQDEKQEPAGRIWLAGASHWAGAIR